MPQSLEKVYNLRPPLSFLLIIKKNNKRPSTDTVREGSVTSSIKYNNLKEGNAIRIRIKAGLIVHINSINVNKHNIFLYYTNYIFV